MIIFSGTIKEFPGSGRGFCHRCGKWARIALASCATCGATITTPLTFSAAHQVVVSAGHFLFQPAGSGSGLPSPDNHSEQHPAEPELTLDGPASLYAATA